MIKALLSMLKGDLMKNKNFPIDHALCRGMDDSFWHVPKWPQSQDDFDNFALQHVNVP